MNPAEYITAVKKTETTEKESPVNQRVLHGLLGLVDEVGELAKHIKAVKCYNQPFDRTNVIEELGDLFWFAAIMIDALDSSFEEVMELNIVKLKKRYGEKFDVGKFVNRDLEAEREVLDASG